MVMRQWFNEQLCVYFLRTHNSWRSRLCCKFCKTCRSELGAVHRDGNTPAACVLSICQRTKLIMNQSRLCLFSWPLHVRPIAPMSVQLAAARASNHSRLLMQAARASLPLPAHASQPAARMQMQNGVTNKNEANAKWSNKQKWVAARTRTWYATL